MKAYLRLACVALALLLPLAALGLDLARKHEAKRPFAGQIPDQLGEWSAVSETELPPEVVEMLAPETYSMRFYEAANRPSLWIYAAFYRGDRPSGPHDPMICYPAAGWSVSEDREMRVELGGTQSFPARFMRGELSGADELVVYWRQPAGRWPGTMPLEYLRRLRDRILGRSEYAFVRISLRRPRSEIGISANDMDALQAMAIALAPWVREAVGP